jgi:hypothetical protein
MSGPHGSRRDPRRRGDRISDVRYWHKADISLCGHNVSFGGKAGIIGPEGQCLLLTQSGHELSLHSAPNY